MRLLRFALSVSCALHMLYNLHYFYVLRHIPITKVMHRIREKMMKKDNRYWDSYVTERVTFCEDGKYRWRYDVNLFKDLDIFWLIWKVLFIPLAAILSPCIRRVMPPW